MGNHLNNYRKGMKRFLFLGLTLLGFIIPHTPAYSQPTKKVKIFLMAGQSNMQGFGTGEMLRKLLCAKEELELPEDPNECYGALPDVEDRIFEMIGDYYGNLQTYDDQNARLVAQLVNENELIDHRLLDPFDQVKAINFNYRRSNGVRSEPTIWSGPLKLGFGNSSSKETFGPELVFGHHIAQYIDEEIILLKVAEGGTDLYEEWRSPSMEARLGVSDEPTNYPLLVEHLTEVQTNISVHFPEYEGLQVETELAGFVWFQGWNDGILPVAPTYAPAYEENLTDLVTDLRNDLDMPDLPVLIAQSQNDDFYGTIIQQAQRAVADQIGNAQSFITTDLSNSFHYDPAAVLVIGDRMAAAMADLLREDASEATPLAPSDFSTTVQPGTVSLSWKDNSYNEDGFRIERSEHPGTGFEEITTESANTRSYTDSDLPKGTYYYRVSAYNNMGNSAYDTVSAVVDKLIPEPWKSIDIGNPPLAGSADYANGLFTVYGNGRGFVQRSDELHFVYQEVSGDGEIVAKVNSLVNSTGEHAVAGLMIRNELPSNSNHGMVALTNDAKIRFRSRGNRGSGTYNDEKDTNAQWIKLSKVDQMVSAYSSIDGTNWELFNEQQLNPFNDYHIGLVVTSNDDMSLAGAVFSEVFILSHEYAVPQAPSDLVATTASTETIMLNWTDNSGDELGFKVERSEVSGSGYQLIGEVAPGVTSYEDQGLNPSTTYFYRIRAFNEAGDSDYSEVASARTQDGPGELPQGWTPIAIGEPVPDGTVDYNSSKESFSVSGTGAGVNGRSDAFYYVHQGTLTNGEIIAKVAVIQASAGIMIRQKLTDDSPHVTMVMDSSSVTNVKSRGHSGASTANYTSDNAPFQWFKLTKEGSVLKAFGSVDGQDWLFEKEYNISRLANDCYIGLVVSGNTSGVPSGEAVFSQVAVNAYAAIPVPLPPLQPVAIATSSSSITLSWTSNGSNVSGYKIERSASSEGGYEQVNEVASGVTSYEDEGLNPATTYFYRVRAFNEAGDSDYSEVASAQTQDGPGELPQGWTPIAIGEPVPDGTVDYNSSKESFSVSGTGAGVNGRSDAFYYVHQGTLTNGEIIAKVAVIQASAGIMIRQKLTDDSPHVTMVMDSSSVTNVKSRGHSGASTANYTSDNAPFQWFKLTKEGSVLKAFGSVDGQDWLFEKEYNISRLANDCYIGLVVSGNTSGVPSGEAVFSQVAVNAYAAIPVPLPPLQPVAIATSSSSITLSWTSNGSNVSGYKIERSASSEDGYEQVSEVAPGVTSYEDEGLNPATTYFYRVRAFNEAGDSDYSEVASTQTQGESGALPAVWTNVDVGEPLVTGTATFENGNFLVSGAGEKVVGRKDEFHYVYQHWVRNGEIIAKVDSLSSTEQGQRAKAGLMIRESLSGTNTRMCFVSYNTNVNEEIVARSRDRKSGGTHQGASNPRTSLPFWLKLVKDGAYFTAYYKPDDTEDWILMYERIVTLDEVYAGLFVNSNNVASASDAVFSEVSVEQVFTPATPRALSVVVNEQNTMTSLTWEDYANGEEGFIIERSTDPVSGYEVIDTLPPNSTTYIDDNPPLANVFYRVKSYDSNGTSQASNVDEVFIGELPGPWKNQEIGASITGGYTAFRDEKWFLNHKGSDTQHPSDHLQYLFQDLSGDGEVIARLADVTGPNNQSIAGMMIRESLDPESKMAFVGWNKDVNEYFLESRSTLGGGTSKVPHSTGAAPAWFRLNRTGDTFTGYYSVNGDNWVQVGQVVINMSDHVVIGAAVSNGGDNETLAVFTEITVNAFDPGIQVLHMPRLVGDSDQSNFPNVIDVHVTADTVGRRNTYTGMQGKTIGVTLAESVHSTYSTISLKFIPDSLNQSVDLLTAGDLVIRLDEDQVSATVGGQQLISEAQISNIICNHVALRFSRQEIGLYVNGEWQVIENVTPFDINQLTLADYKGQTWDIQVHKGLLSNTAIEKISQLCVPSVDASEHSPYNELYTQAICGSYKCLWAKADVDLMQDRFIYHIYEQDIAFELFTFEAGMYVHGDIESILAYENGRNWLVTDDEKLIRGSFSNPMNSDGGSGHHWYHENFHGQQGFHPGEGYGGGKWLFEASANWGASYRYDYLPTGGFTGVTLYPHYAMTWDKTYDVPDGNRDYHHYILLSSFVHWQAI